MDGDHPTSGPSKEEGRTGLWSRARWSCPVSTAYHSMSSYKLLYLSKESACTAGGPDSIQFAWDYPRLSTTSSAFQETPVANKP